MQKIQARSLRQEDPLEKEMATHSNILARRIPMDREAWQATVHEVTEVLECAQSLSCIQLFAAA